MDDREQGSENTTLGSGPSPAPFQAEHWACPLTHPQPSPPLHYGQKTPQALGDQTHPYVSQPSSSPEMGRGPPEKRRSLGLSQEPLHCPHRANSLWPKRTFLKKTLQGGHKGRSLQRWLLPTPKESSGNKMKWR